MMLKNAFFILILIFFKNMLIAQNNINMNEGWRMKAAFPDEKKGLKEEWLDAKVPALAHSVLMENKVLPDLFYRDNESKYQWLEDEDWVFEKIFDADENILKNEHIELIFKGLDTNADVFFNGHLVLKANNAFRSWTINAKEFLKAKNNLIRIYFYSAVRNDRYKQLMHGYNLPGIPTNERVFSRKAQFNYGWDWGPRFVSAGLWRGVELKVWNDIALRDLNVKQISLNDNEAILKADFEFENNTIGEKEISLRIDNHIFTKKINCETIGKQLFSIENIVLKNPRRWWSVGLGEAYLYEAFGEIKSGTESDVISQKIGLRTLDLVREKDKAGETFFFRLNGVPVFAKGANYIPMSVFQDKIKQENYEKLTSDVVAANMNMIRVWGGGIYENDEFYELCDQKGIMVWQDFMYACAMYPGDAAFFENAKQEAIENVKRLRHHPSIALWCGNNEINEAWHNWGWQIPFALQPKRRDAIWQSYKTLFMSILPSVVSENANGTKYWESSPSYSRFNPKSESEGDSHYWGVWHDEEPFEQYEKRVPRFMSEYGFQSFPEWKTILNFTEPQDRDLETPVMLVHQKHPRGNTLMRKYMGREYHVPSKFEDFVYVSQLVQAEGMQRGIEAHRRAMPYCMGTLYWQLNDVWPVASWSGIDGDGRWKALHYAARESFQPLLISPLKNGKMLEINIISDFLDNKIGDLTVEIFDFEGKKINSETKKHLTVKANSSHGYEQINIAHLLKNYNPNHVFALFTFKNEEKTLATRVFYFDYPKNLQLPTAHIEQRTEATSEGYRVILQSSKLAKNVFIQTDAKGTWSDNYFDILPNETKIIEFKLESGDFHKDFLIKSLVQTY